MIALLFLLTVALAAPLTADVAVGRALERAWVIEEARAEVETARGEVRATVLLAEDPTLHGHWAAVGDARGISVTQPLSLSGEGLAARRSARAALEQAEATLERRRLEVAADTRRAWVRAVEARQVVALSEEALALATRLRGGAESHEESGDGSLLDARLARLQEEEARSTWMVAVVDEGKRLAELSVRTGEGVGDIELPLDPLDGMQVVEPGTGARSDLSAARHRVEAAEAALRQARAGTVPPLQIGAFFEEEGDELRAGPSVAVTVPLWSGNAGGRAHARAELAVAESAVAERALMVTAEQQAAARVAEALEAGSDDVDPREEARVALEGVALGYQRGELDLLTAGLLRQQIIWGQRVWLEGRRVRAEARIDIALAYEDGALLP